MTLTEAEAVNGSIPKYGTSVLKLNKHSKEVLKCGTLWNLSTVGISNPPGGSPGRSQSCPWPHHAHRWHELHHVPSVDETTSSPGGAVPEKMFMAQSLSTMDLDGSWHIQWDGSWHIQWDSDVWNLRGVQTLSISTTWPFGKFAGHPRLGSGADWSPGYFRRKIFDLSLSLPLSLIFKEIDSCTFVWLGFHPKVWFLYVPLNHHGCVKII